MKRILVFTILALIVVFPLLGNTDALRQVAGKIAVDIKPGQTQTFEWGLASDKEKEITTVEIHAEGDGAEFLSFEKSLDIDPKALVFMEVTVSIPEDYSGGIELQPHLIATEFGEKGGATIINIRMLKIVTLNIAPNDDPALWVDWDAIAAEKEEQVTEEEQVVQQSIKEEKEQPKGLTIAASPESEPESVCGAGTHEENGVCVPDKSGGGCLIATATFGSELAPQVQFLREVRDNTVLSTTSGSSFMNSFNQFYYSFSPTIADWERQSPVFKEIVKITITPLLTSLSLLNYVDIDSEEEMLGYGIGIILINVGMYFAAPTIVIFELRRRF